MKVCLLNLMILLVILSCTDDNPSNNNINVIKPKEISALINDVSFKAETISIEMEFGTHNKILAILGIKGTDTLKLNVGFEADDTLKTGTYSLLDSNSYAVYHHENAVDTTSEGEVYIETLDENYPVKAAGTFNFVIKENDQIKYNVTNGIFNSGNIK